MPAAIETRLLTKRYRRTLALDSVTLQVPTGSVYALVGANGAGKTTLIRLLMNMFQPSAGTATVLGVASDGVAGRVFERIGYVSENQEMLEGLTVEGLLNYVRPFYLTWDRNLEAQLIRQFGLPLQRRLKHLSRGMKMKAALCSVLPYRPALIVLDEPFSGLDPLVRDELIESLRERTTETTVVLSSHDLSEIESFATHVGFLEQGRLLFSEELSVLMERFREIEVMTSGTPNTAVMRNLPATWLNVQSAGEALRFVDSHFTPATSAELAGRFPDAVKITIQPMALRSIFVAIAKAGRTQAINRAGESEAA